MVGADAADASAGEWKTVAGFYAEAQLRSIHDAALQVLSSAAIPNDAPLVVAGSGRFVVEKLAARLGRPAEHWEALVPAESGLAGAISDCAPAVAVALLAAR